MPLRLTTTALLVLLVQCALPASPPYPYPPTFGKVSLIRKVTVGCHHSLPGPGCWVPGFTGTDSSPSVVPGSGGLVTIGSYDGNLYALNPLTGVVGWKVAGAGGEGSPKVGGNHVYAWGGLQGKYVLPADS
jgi:hypothetical protein